MKKGIPKPKLGDIYQIRVPSGIAYVQYILYHKPRPTYGSVIRVLPGIYSSPQLDPNSLVSNGERFLAFYHVSSALNDNVLHKVGHAPVPDRFVTWPLFKNAPGTKWRIWDGTHLTLEDPLALEHYDLPEWELIPDSILIERIESNWHPRDEVFRKNPELKERYDRWVRDRDHSAVM